MRRDVDTLGTVVGCIGAATFGDGTALQRWPSEDFLSIRLLDHPSTVILQNRYWVGTVTLTTPLQVVVLPVHIVDTDIPVALHQQGQVFTSSLRPCGPISVLLSILVLVQHKVAIAWLQLKRIWAVHQLNVLVSAANLSHRRDPANVGTLLTNQPGYIRGHPVDTLQIITVTVTVSATPRTRPGLVGAGKLARLPLLVETKCCPHLTGSAAVFLVVTQSQLTTERQIQHNALVVL
mmetsp:Transcript_62019/g.110485  ORF Transcript_62019/g.110485 Transcript_62019/m.110485 type:complete len:235 (-) Transcript_62019:813-1517(-)